MPDYLIKPDPGADFYVCWSTVVDAPEYWGTKGELQKDVRPDGKWAEERFARADDNGTSANWDNWPKAYQPFAWGCRDFMIREVIPSRDGHYSVLPRANLRAFVDAMDQALMDSLVTWHACD